MQREVLLARLYAPARCWFFTGQADALPHRGSGEGDAALLARPPGVMAIGGVITSTPLTLLAIPLVYERFGTARDRAAAPFRRRRAARAHVHDGGRALGADAPAEDVVAVA